MKTRTIIAGLVAAIAIGHAPAIIAEAQADPVTDYAATYGFAVCETLDEYPTFNGIMGLGLGIVDDGYLSYYQAGQVMRLSAEYLCPRHLPLILAFAAAYGDSPVFVA